MTDDVLWHAGQVAPEERSTLTGGPGVTVWLTGLSGSGKSTVAFKVEETLVGQGRAAYVLDGDNLRHGLNADLGFSTADRSENVRRVGEVALLMADGGMVALVPVISPYAADRALVRSRHTLANVRFVEVFVDTPLEICEQRDPKGLYKAARAGEISNFTGISDPYEPPTAAEVRLDGSALSEDQAASDVVAAVLGL